jgi:hypothetical protein
MLEPPVSENLTPQSTPSSSLGPDEADVMAEDAEGDLLIVSWSHGSTPYRDDL